MAKSNDWILYAGAVAVGLYAVYTISKPLKDTAGNIATATQGLGTGISQGGIAAGDLLTKTGGAAGGVITTTGDQVSGIIQGVGGTVKNTTDLTQWVTAEPLNIIQRAEKAYEDLAPIDWIKHKILGY